MCRYRLVPQVTEAEAARPHYNFSNSIDELITRAEILVALDNVMTKQSFNSFKKNQKCTCACFPLGQLLKR